MIHQRYDDWRRMLETCCAASLAPGYGLADWPDPIGDAVAALNHDSTPSWQTPEESARFKLVARTLGIDRRKRLDWTHGARASQADNRKVSCVLEDAGFGKVPGTWSAASGGDVWTAIFVYEHPTRESAIEHLERLLGREG